MIENSKRCTVKLILLLFLFIISFIKNNCTKMQLQKDLLNSDEFINTVKRRRDMIPWWMRIFIWIFLILGFLVPFCILLKIAGINVDISIYGIESNSMSMMIISLACIFLLKGFVAFGLWTEKSWAIELGMIDALTGITLCGLMMILSIYQGTVFTFRLELLALIPYLLKLKKIKSKWIYSVTQ